MAFVDEEQDEEGQDPAGAGGAGGVTTSAESSVISGAQGGAPDQKGDKGAGNFVGLQTYLNANKPQAEKLGGQVAGVVQKSGDEARSGIQNLNNTFNQKVDQNTVANTQTLGETPESLAQDQREQLKKQYNAQYKGPTQISDLGDMYTNTLGQLNKANQNIQAAGTEEGRGQLITQVNDKPRTQGITQFDNLLLQKGASRDKIEQAANQNRDLSQVMDATQANAVNKVGRLDDPNTPENEASGALGTTAQTKADTYKAVQDALTGWQSGLDKRVEDTRNQNVGLQSRVTDDVAGGDLSLSQETMDLLGLTENTHTYKLKPSDYLNPYFGSDVNKENVASQEDYARYGALADIAGIQDQYLNQENVGKAGTAPSFTVQKDKLATDLAKTKADYEYDYKNNENPKLGPLAFDKEVFVRNNILQDPNVIAQVGEAPNVPRTKENIKNVYIPFYESLEKVMPQYGFITRGLAAEMNQRIGDLDSEEWGYKHGNRITKAT